MTSAIATDLALVSAIDADGQMDIVSPVSMVLSVVSMIELEEV